MLLRDTILKDLRSFIATAFIVCLAMPGSASATVILDLTDSGQLSSGDYTSGSVFRDIDIGLGLGWDLTVTASGDENLTVTGHGTGVDGKGLTGELNANEWIEFAFSPDASLTGFTIVDGRGDFVAYTVNGGTGGSGGEQDGGEDRRGRNQLPAPAGKRMAPHGGGDGKTGPESARKLEGGAGGRGAGRAGQAESVVEEGGKTDEVHECVWTDRDNDHSNDIRDDER